MSSPILTDRHVLIATLLKMMVNTVAPDFWKNKPHRHISHKKNECDHVVNVICSKNMMSDNVYFKRNTEAESNH